MLDLSKNYFELFGLPVSYTVDKEQLSQRYRELQKTLHPDRFANATDQERRLSMQGAVLVNEALQTLKEPVQRARYLLTLNGFNMDAQQDTTRDSEFLMEQMMLREELESTRNSADPYQALSEFMSGVDRKIDALAEKMAEQFELATPEQLEAARENLLKMQFLKKLYSDAEALESELDDEL